MFISVALLFSVLVFGVISDPPSRILLTTFNPGCVEEKHCDCGPGLSYVKSIGTTDILHFVISAIGGPPTVMVIRTNKPKNPDAGLMIDCKKIASQNETERRGAISLGSLKELYSFGLVFIRLFQYNDTTDKADIAQYGINSTAWRVYDFKDFEWEDMKDASSNTLMVMKVKESASVDQMAIVNASLVIQVHLFDHTDRSDTLPHLLYNADSAQIDFTLQNIDTGNSSSARWALEAMLLGRDPPTSTMKIDETKSLDDEYTPGVFTISNWLTRPGRESVGAYLQWKPVCYLKAKRARSSATKINHYDLRDTADEHLDGVLNTSVTFSYYENLQSLSRTANNFSFGLEKDGGFTKTNYTSWTLQLGYGTPPKDKVSSLVIGIISAGLGIPVIIILFGGLYVIIKKKMTSEYEKVDGVDKNQSLIQ